MSLGTSVFSVILSSSVSTSHWANFLCACIMKGTDCNFYGKKIFLKCPQLTSHVPQSRLDIGHGISMIGLENPFGHPLLAYGLGESVYYLSRDYSRCLDIIWHIIGFHLIILSRYSNPHDYYIWQVTTDNAPRKSAKRPSVHCLPTLSSSPWNPYPCSQLCFNS